MIPCPLQSAAGKAGNRPVIISSQEILTWRQLNERVNAAVEYFRTLGMSRGKRVSIAAPAGPEYLTALLALWRIKAVACPINTRQPPAALSKQLSSIQCRRILTSLSSFELSAREPEEKPRKCLYSLNQDATILFTSGSTAAPKAVLHTFGNHYFNALGSAKLIPVKAGDRWLLTLPLYHVSGLSILFRILLGKGTLVLPDPQKTLAQNIEAFRITHISLVSTQLRRLVQECRVPKTLNRLKSLKHVLVGGSAIAPPLIRQAAELNLPIHITYGSTEAASQVATTKLTKDRLVGKAKILHGREVQISTQNEIWIKGKTLFKGYVIGRRLQRPFKQGGWFPTGDFGRVIDGRYLEVFGRKDRMFISGGENIYPEEIERFLLKLDEVEKAEVVPVPHKEFGRRPAAFIKFRRGRRLPPQTLSVFLAKHLPKYKIPDKFYSA